MNILLFVTTITNDQHSLTPQASSGPIYLVSDFCKSPTKQEFSNLVPRKDVQMNFATCLKS